MRRVALILLAVFAATFALAQQRFDFKVREGMFAGFDGDREAFDRAMALVARTLEIEPDHAEALSWRGAGRLFLSGQAFGRRDLAQGQTLSAQGLADLDRAVRLQPDSTSVRGARGPALMPFARNMRPFNRAEADRLTRLAMSDFEFIVVANAAQWDRLSEHSRGELLGALAEGWLDLEEPAKAMPFLDRMIVELPNTSYSANATVRRADPAAGTALTCLGCH
jgi:hypothetical protein